MALRTEWPVIFSKKIQGLFKQFSSIFFKSHGHEKDFGELINKCFEKTLDSN